MLADVIDNVSWRLLENGAYIDKQVYRDGGGLDTVAAKYKQVAETPAISAAAGNASSCGAARKMTGPRHSPRRLAT